MLSRQEITKFIPAALAVWSALMLTHPVPAQWIDEHKALKVTAAFLFNFAKFVTWPDTAFEHDKVPFVIGVLGDDPFGHILEDSTRTRKIRGRSIEIRRYRWSPDEDRQALRSCHLLYISSSEGFRLDEVLAALKKHPVLVVSDIPEFVRAGGMIGLTVENQRIVFEINRESLAKSALIASARLLDLARNIDSKKHGDREIRTTSERP